VFSDQRLTIILAIMLLRSLRIKPFETSSQCTGGGRYTGGSHDKAGTRKQAVAFVALFTIFTLLGASEARADTGNAVSTDRVAVIAAGRLDAGNAGTCAVRAAGYIQCWGSDFGGQNGNGPNGDSFNPATVRAGDGKIAFRSVSRGSNFVCAIGDSGVAPYAKGVVYCWGFNGSGQALGATPSYETPESFALPPAGTTWSAITTGFSHACALTSLGDVYCWGANGTGQLGQGNTVPLDTPTKVVLPGGVKATTISAGQGHVCAILTDKRLLCWGNGFQGQLGNGAENDIGDDEALTLANTIITMPGNKGVLAVSAGNDHTCVILEDSKVTCWGLALQGRTGGGAPPATGKILSPPAPIVLPAPGTARAISSGGGNSCAILTDGKVSCWGGNALGAIGLGTALPANQLVPSAPIRLPRDEAATAISVGDSHVCALLASDDVSCWGSNQEGRSGYSSPAIIGDNETPFQQGPVTFAYDTTRYQTLAPQRILDTRPGSPIGYSGPKPVAQSSVRLQIPNLAPGGSGFVGAVILNVTVTDATGAGFVTVYPSLQPLPEASNLNVGYTGQTIANLVTVQLGVDGAVNLYSFSGGHLIVDLVGFYVQSEPRPDGRLQTALAPTRVLDTRAGAAVPKPPAGTTLTVPIKGRNGVPAAGIEAVVLNVTADDAIAAGYVTVWPDGTRPNVSNINLDRRGQTLPNQVIVPIGADGAIRIFTEQGAHIIVDVTGWFTDSTASVSALGLFVPLSPFRHLDTRRTTKVVAGGTVDAVIEGVFHVYPGGVSAVSANITGVDATSAGYISAYPPAPAPPNASNLNLGPGETIANHATVRINLGKIRLFSERGAHLLVDVNGYYI
jgi:alpha-tubulin suppressor-like RCC1 family protein